MVNNGATVVPPRDLGEELRAAVKLLGGTRRTALLSSVHRSKLDYWCHINCPYWAEPYVDRIVKLARRPSNHKQQGARPPWAVAKLKQRRHAHGQ